MNDLFADFPVGVAVTMTGLPSGRGVVVAHYEITAAAPNSEVLPTRLLGIRWGTSARLAFWDSAENGRHPLAKAVTE